MRGVAPEPVRRPSDGELCGHIERREGEWLALTVFGAILGGHDSREGAIEMVLADGLASLAERWTLREAATLTDEIVCIQEASPECVIVVRGYYPGPDVPLLTITAAELATGAWELRLR